MVIAIDGPAGAGKSSVARGVADELGFTYLDSGAMYRCVALAGIEAGADLDDGEAIGEVARGIEIGLDGPAVLLDGRDVSEAIRTAEVTDGAARASVHPQVRRVLVEAQRRMIDVGPLRRRGARHRHRRQPRLSAEGLPHRDRGGARPPPCRADRRTAFCCARRPAGPRRQRSQPRAWRAAGRRGRRGDRYHRSLAGGGGRGRGRPGTREEAGVSGFRTPSARRGNRAPGAVGR